uniref:Uncharacterized protein n=1 Tax=Octopus bimaculoides TaxID=37653 RepID=A0A0L8FKY5_OCTBM
MGTKYVGTLFAFVAASISILQLYIFLGIGDKTMERVLVSSLSIISWLLLSFSLFLPQYPPPPPPLLLPLSLSLLKLLLAVAINKSSICYRSRGFCYYQGLLWYHILLVPYLYGTISFWSGSLTY